MSEQRPRPMPTAAYWQCQCGVNVHPTWGHCKCGRPRAVSEFQKKLDADPELRRRFEETAREIREAAADDIAAAERSEQLTAEDFAIVINARAPGQ